MIIKSNQKSKEIPQFAYSFNVICIFISGSLAGTQVAHQLVVAIRQKCSPEEVINILKDLPNTTNENADQEMSDASYNPLKIDVFVQTLLNLGSKSFSHSFAAISKFHLLFKVKYLYIIIENTICQIYCS